MKKIIILILVVLSICGCSNKLVCSKENDNNKDEVTATFKYDKLVSINGSLVATFKNSEEKEVYKYVYDATKLILENEGYNVSKEDNDETITVFYNASLNEQDINSFNKDTSKDDYVKKMESDGFSCK